MDTNLTGLWVSFFTAAGIPSDVAATYALTFTENRIQNDMLLDLNKEYLRDMGITRMGDVIAILRHAKQVHENTARDKVLNTTLTTNKVPVAAITGRSTSTQPSSPASRILEHYTRNSPTQDTSQVTTKKRKLVEVRANEDASVKKARLIRFASPSKSPVEVAPAIVHNKQTVFSRLGNSEAVIVAQKKTTSLAPAKPIFARLGSKSENVGSQTIPIHRDALKYEGILKSQPVVKKTVTVTAATKNNVRRIAVGTMRADQVPVSVKEKLAITKAKSVKFANHVEYKEIEGIQKNTLVKPKVVHKLTQVFNKPERRLSMPETPAVKARLGTKNANNLTITRNVFNRLGV
ncbi:unnamed protein product [Diatraea saccharalis]|uniref:SAM domain-containing protein n=1 Tax=Diatraea saccharalis TaxID=40085 RepID=A0A9P0G1L8_9NEOP|nr:unnamed protein product [Diatraea saccharalis]